MPTVDRPPGLALGPRSIERPTDAGWTLVGGIDDPDPARVDGGGLVAPAGAGWLVDWWVGADDRWYLPAREPSIRQRRIGAGPVIETSMRVPSGDVVATAYPVLGSGGGRATAIEVHNASPVPVALAVAIRPVPIDGGRPSVLRIERPDPATVAVDGRPAVLLPRPPNEAGADGGADLLDRVTAGHPLAWPGPVTGELANAVCLFPLPHDTSLRFTVLPALAIGALPAGSAGSPAVEGVRPGVLPPPDTVARGWTSVVERPATFSFPEAGLGALAAAARARLVLAAPELSDRLTAIDGVAALALHGLAAGGHADECRRVVAALAETFPTRLPDRSSVGGSTHGSVGGSVDGSTHGSVGGSVGGSASAHAAATVAAAAAAAELLGPDAADGLLAAMTQLTTLVDRSGDRVSTAIAELALARLAGRAGQTDAARGLRRRVQPPRVGSDAVELDQVTDLAQRASPAGSWPPDDAIEPAARFWLMARSLLLRSDDQAPDRPTVRLLPTMPAAWLGGEIEVHRAPVAGAQVSFAIRWHGHRPALLWQIEAVGSAGAQRPLRLSCPGLDPDWETDEPSGETLLAGTPDHLPPAPEPGQSFG